MDSRLELFHYNHIDNDAPLTVFTLHGTGGTEDDFLFLDRLLSKRYNLVGLRGNVSENGMNRFFRRTAPGVFDQESIRTESGKLQQFVRAWMLEHHVEREQAFMLGYSNGANIILATLMYYPGLVGGLVLMHPMLPVRDETADLSHTKGLLTYGLTDRMISPDSSREAITVLRDAGVDLTVKDYPSGHEVSEQELKDVVAWLDAPGSIA